MKFWAVAVCAAEIPATNTITRLRSARHFTSLAAIISSESTSCATRHLLTPKGCQSREDGRTPRKLGGACRDLGEKYASQWLGCQSSPNGLLLRAQPPCVQ